MAFDIMSAVTRQAIQLRCVWNVSFLVAPLALVLAALAACEGAPARSKPWRRAEPAKTLGRMGDAGVPSPGEAAADSKSRRDVLRIHMEEDPGPLAPFSEPSVWAERIVADTIFESLIRLGPGRPDYIPALAASFSVSPDGRELHFALREGVRFHDGRAMSAVDVQFSIDSFRLGRGRRPGLRSALRAISSVEVLGPSKLRVRLSRADGYVLRALVELPIVPLHVYGGGRGESPLIGTGPYRLESRGEVGVALRKNAEYWGGAPALAGVDFVAESDAAAALRAAGDGQIDIIPSLLGVHRPRGADPGALVEGFETLRLRPPWFRYLLFNVRKAPFDDLALRAAAAAAIDREALAEKTGGAERPVDTPIWPGGPGAAAPSSRAAAAPGDVGRALDAAGWLDADGDGIRTRQGRRLLVTVLATPAKNPVRDTALEMLRAVGFVIDPSRRAARGAHEQVEGRAPSILHFSNGAGTSTATLSQSSAAAVATISAASPTAPPTSFLTPSTPPRRRRSASPSFWPWAPASATPGRWPR